MKLMKWSNEQSDAIYSTNCPIVVSAGAGSGKTAVLTERIFDKIYNKHIPLQSLIVLTFTNAAAMEMKIRVAKKLNEAPIMTEEIKNALDYIDQANITTFDAYSLKIVKKYGYLLNLSDDINISDDVIVDRIKNECLTEIFEKYYANEDFRIIANAFAIKNDDRLRSAFIALYNKLEYKIDLNKFLEDSKYYISDEFYKKTNEFLMDFIEKELKDIEDDIISLELFIEGSEIKPKYDNIIDKIKEFFNSKGKSNFRIDIRTEKDENEYNEFKTRATEIKKKVNFLKNNNLFKSSEELYDLISSNKNVIKTLIDVYIEFNDLFNRKKVELGLNTFSDIAKKSIKILSDFKWVRDEIKYNTSEILIDEYQDTSDVQDYFISLIENNNTYYVGDVKQSIYGFRGANPSLFMEKCKNSNLISLLNNFRSRNDVLDCVNNLFTELMSIESSGIDYKDNHKLNYGFKKYDECKNDYEALIYTYDVHSKDTELSIIINDIKEKVDNLDVYDKNTNSFRKAKYSDFAILASSKDLFSEYKEAFNLVQIPLIAYEDNKFLEGDEVLVIFSLLKYSYNYDLRSGYSILRSFLYEYNDEFSNEDFDDLKEKINKVKNDSKTPYELLEGLIYEFDLFYKLTKLDNFELRRLRVYKLLEVSKSVLNIPSNEFTIEKYFDYIENNYPDYKFEITIPNDNSVVMMTIHKSKGLEFPICYFPQLYKKFNEDEKNEKIMFSNKFGYVFNLQDEDVYINNPLKEFIKDEINKNIIAERLRLFYVALTRAREKIILLSPNDEKLVDNILEAKSFNQFLKLVDGKIKKVSKEFVEIPRVEQKSYSAYKDKEIIIKEISYKKQEIKKTISSHQTKELLDDDVKDILKIGIKFHKYFEIIDFKNYEESLEGLNLTKFEENKLRMFFENPILKDFKNVYKEHYFKQKISNIEKIGIIDLILEYDDKIIIIDYKLSDTSKDYYLEQLRSYKDYLKNVFNKPIFTYLYSIMKGSLTEICLE